jgi:hypothetical protein
MKVDLGVPSTEYLVKQFIFLAVMQTTFSLLRKQRFTYPLTGNGRLLLTLGNVLVECCSASDRSSFLSRNLLNNVFSVCSGFNSRNIYKTRFLLPGNLHIQE